MKKYLLRSISLLCVVMSLITIMGASTLAAEDEAADVDMIAAEVAVDDNAAEAEEDSLPAAEEPDGEPAAAEESAEAESSAEETAASLPDEEELPAVTEAAEEAVAQSEEDAEGLVVDSASAYQWKKSGSTWYLYKDSVKVTGFATVNDKIYYLDPDAGGNACAGWKKINGTWYYFDKSTREAVKGLQYLDSYYYFFNEDDGALRQESRLIKASDGSLYYVDKYCHALSGWRKIDGNWYYFGYTKKYALTGLWTIDGDKYYFDENGVMQTGLIQVTDERAGVKDKWYYFAAPIGAAKSGWYQPSEGIWYYFGSSSKQALTGFWTVSGTGRYFGPDGILVSGNGKYVGDDGKTYYLNNFIAKTGWVKDNGEWLYFSPSTGERVMDGLVTSYGEKYYFKDGVLQTGLIWVTDEKAGVDHELYYFTSGGEAKSGWYQPSEGIWYYFGSSSKRALTGFWTVSGVGRYFGSDGILVSGNGEYKAEDGNTYYLSNFIAKTGWIKNKDDKWTYYLSSTGERVENSLLSVNGKKYWCKEDGTLFTDGFKKVKSNTYYFTSTGAAKSGWLLYNGEYYYFSKSSYEMLTGWHVINGYTYYFYTGDDGGTAGMMAHDTTIDGYTLKSSGVAKISTKEAMQKYAQYFSSKTKYLCMIDTENCRVGVFTGSQGNWTMKYYWECTTGKSGHETPTGIFETDHKHYNFGNSVYECYYGTAFAHIGEAEYLFHSLLYYPGTNTIKGVQLGQHASNGCVRLAIGNAKWLYQNIPEGTKVVSY